MGANLTPKNNGNETRKITCKEDLNDDEVKNVEKLIISLYNLVFEIFSASAGSPGVRLNCLTTIKKMFYYGQIETLSEVLFNQKNLKDLSSNIKSMLSGSNLEAIIASLQISNLLMNRMPAQFEDSFQRQGVVYQIAKLLEADNKIVGENSTPATPSTSSSNHDADLPPSFMSMMDFPATLDTNDSFRDFIMKMGGGPSMFTKKSESNQHSADSKRSEPIHIQEVFQQEVDFEHIHRFNQQFLQICSCQCFKVLNIYWWCFQGNPHCKEIEF